MERATKDQMQIEKSQLHGGIIRTKSASRRGALRAVTNVLFSS